MLTSMLTVTFKYEIIRFRNYRQWKNIKFNRIHTHHKTKRAHTLHLPPFLKFSVLIRFSYMYSTIAYNSIRNVCYTLCLRRMLFNARIQHSHSRSLVCFLIEKKQLQLEKYVLRTSIENLCNNK